MSITRAATMDDDILLEGGHCRSDLQPGDRLSLTQIDELLIRLPDWRLVGTDAIEREFSFPSYPATMLFVNSLAWLAERENHHPDLTVGYRQVKVRFSTHSLAGLSHNDFICAAKIDALARI
jgi:4a-hydroxytetrahydrobiopterin dehydratase